MHFSKLNLLPKSEGFLFYTFSYFTVVLCSFSLTSNDDKAERVKLFSAKTGIL